LVIAVALNPDFSISLIRVFHRSLSVCWHICKCINLYCAYQYAWFCMIATIVSLYRSEILRSEEEKICIITWGRSEIPYPISASMRETLICGNSVGWSDIDETLMQSSWKHSVLSTRWPSLICQCQIMSFTIYSERDR
jgi:hypothetical protein